MKKLKTRKAYNKLELKLGEFERDIALKPTVKRFRVKSKFSRSSKSQQLQSSVSTLTSDNSFRRNILLTSLLASQMVPVDSLSRPKPDNSTSPFSPPNHLKFSPLNTTKSPLVRINSPSQTQFKSSIIITKRKDPKDHQRAIVKSIDQSPQVKFKFLLELFKKNKHRDLDFELKKMSIEEIKLFLSSTSIIIDLAKKRTIANAFLDILELAKSNNEIFKIILDKLSSEKNNIFLLLITNKNKVLAIKVFEILHHQISIGQFTDQQFFDLVAKVGDSIEPILHTIIRLDNEDFLKLFLSEVGKLQNKKLVQELLLIENVLNLDSPNALQACFMYNNPRLFEVILSHFKDDYNELVTLLNSQNHHQSTSPFFAVILKSHPIAIPIFKIIANAFKDDPNKIDHLFELFSTICNSNQDNLFLMTAKHGETALFNEILPMIDGKLAELIKFKNSDGENMLFISLKNREFEFFTNLIAHLKKKIDLKEFFLDKNKYGYTLLYHSAVDGFDEFFINILLNHENIQEVIKSINQTRLYGSYNVVLVNQIAYLGIVGIFDKINEAVNHFVSDDDLKIKILEQIFFPNDDLNANPALMSVNNNKIESFKKILSIFHPYPKILIKLIGNDYKGSLCALSNSIYNNYPEAFKILMDNLVLYFSKETIKQVFTKPSDNNITPISFAIYLNRADFLSDMLNQFDNDPNLLYEILLDQGINNNTPLIQAIIRGNYQVFEILFLKTLELSEKIDQEKIDNLSIIKALILASSTRNFKMVEFILSKIESSNLVVLLNKNNLSECLTHLALSGNEELVNKVLKLDLYKFYDTDIQESPEHPIDLSAKSSNIDPDRKLSVQLSTQEYSPSLIKNSLEFFLHYVGFIKTLNHDSAKSEFDLVSKIKLFKKVPIELIVSPTQQFIDTPIVFDNLNYLGSYQPIFVDINGQKKIFSEINLIPNFNNVGVENIFTQADNCNINEIIFNANEHEYLFKNINNFTIKLTRVPGQNWVAEIFQDFEEPIRENVKTSIKNHFGNKISNIIFKPYPILESELPNISTEDKTSQNIIAKHLNTFMILSGSEFVDKFKSPQAQTQKLGMISDLQNMLSINKFAGYISRVTENRFNKIKKRLNEEMTPSPALSPSSANNQVASEAKSIS
jgi:hypothetical protein